MIVICKYCGCIFDGNFDKCPCCKMFWKIDKIENSKVIFECYL